MADGKYRLLLALLSGVGFTAGIALLLNIPSPIVLMRSVFLIPGTLITALFLHLHALGFGPPVPVLILNGVVYSSAAYLLLDRWLCLKPHTAKLFFAVLMMPVTVLACLACVPSQARFGQAAWRNWRNGREPAAKPFPLART